MKSGGLSPLKIRVFMSQYATSTRSCASLFKMFFVCILFRLIITNAGYKMKEYASE